ncbi:hypothetical protein STRAU_6311 [Streptomyces aurantiacus JA 4570]|uniref:Uncharacterized protein n=1 Tax=Streptomyces aurantiacus JA 4570 TaxID=1286094 RepID=S3ZDD1_9ACTN|nr:hypothetical protein STRAU_6311 [Streptomyces aurantiacus JA 4570]
MNSIVSKFDLSDLTEPTDLTDLTGSMATHLPPRSSRRTTAFAVGGVLTGALLALAACAVKVANANHLVHERRCGDVRISRALERLRDVLPRRR